jgi:hypothetical protein
MAKMAGATQDEPGRRPGGHIPAGETSLSTPVKRIALISRAESNLRRNSELGPAEL